MHVCVHMCIYVYIYIYMYIYTYVYIYIYIYMYTHMYAYVCIYIYIYTYIHSHVLRTLSPSCLHFARVPRRAWCTRDHTHTHLATWTNGERVRKTRGCVIRTSNRECKRIFLRRNMRMP